MSLPSFVTGPSQDQAAQAAMPTPEALARRQALAMALLRAGSDSSPIRSPWQGVARVTDAISGAVQSHWADQDAAKAMQAGANMYAQGLGQAFGGIGAGAGGAGQQAAMMPSAGAGGAAPVAPDAIKGLIAQYVPPEMQDYATRLIGKESSFNPSAVSSTGATGLAQFTKRTGALYGLVGQNGDMRADPDLNIQALVKLTNDNRAGLQQALGRTPTWGETALAHQQGLQGAISLLSGQGVDPNNLSVNNVAPGTDPRAAAQKIMAYYDMGAVGGQPAPSAPQPSASPPVADAGNVPLPPQDPRGVQVASADPNFVPQMPAGGGAGPQASTPPVNPGTGLVPDAALKQGNFQPGSLTPAQGKAYADAGYNVPNAAINWGSDGTAPQGAAPTPSTGAAAVTQAIAGGQQTAQASPPSAGSPSSGAAAVAGAMSNGPQAPPAAPSLSSGGQAVANAMSPQPAAPPAPVAAFQGAQGQAGIGQDQLRSLAAIMANPWISDSQKQMLNNTIMSRLMPHRMIPIQTGQGTMMVDEITGQQRGFIPTANNQVIENQDGSRSIVNTNDPNAVSAYNQRGAGAGAGANAFPGQPLTNEMKDYNAVVAQAKASGQTPPTFQQYQLDLKKQGAQSVVITGEGAEAKTAGESAGTRRAQMLAAADAAPGVMSRIQLLRNVLQQTKTGPLAGVLGQAGGLASALGISGDTLKEIGIDPNQAVDNQIAEKMSNKMVSESIGAGKGIPASNFSVAERQFIEKMYPNIANQPGANEAVSDVLLAEQQHALDMADAWSAFKQTAKGKGQIPSYEDFEDQWRQQHGKDNIFQPVIDKFNAGGYSNLGTQAPGIGPQTNDQAGAPPPAAAGIPQGAPPGTRRAPDGNFYAPDPQRPGKWLKVN